MINSVTTFWLSHVLHLRGCMIREASKCRIRAFQILFVFKLIVLCILVIVGPFLEAFISKRNNSNRENLEFEFVMNCSDPPRYPTRFLLIFALDVVSALIDFIIFITAPKIENK